MNRTFSVLRIKRKRDDSALPLEALVIDDDRNSKRRKSGPLPPPTAGIFRFAETVPIDSFATANGTRLVGDRIAATFLANRSFPPASPLSPPPAPAPAPPARKRPLSLDPPESRPAPAVDSSTTRARYRVIDSTRRSAEAVARRRGLLPPVVTSAGSAQLEAAASSGVDPFLIYDAVEEGGSSRGPARILDSNGGSDDLMDNFVPMLQEYLSLQNSVHRPVIVPDPQVDEPDDDSGDEVYDVYYRDLREPALETGAGATDVGTLAGLKRIGALAGLVEEDVLTSELSSEDEDEADQDSNEENDYRNDYPSSDESEDCVDESSGAEDSD